MRRSIAVMILALPAFFFVETPDAGPWLPLAEKVFAADFIVELRLSLEEPIPQSWPNQDYDPQGWSFPDRLLKRATKAATVERVLKSPPGSGTPELPENLFVFSTSSPCWWKAHHKKSFTTLAFFEKDAEGALRQVFGVEHERGLYSDLSPHYPQLVSAIEEVAGWHEERMRAVHYSMLWQAQRRALESSDDPYLLRLAVHFLLEKGEEGVVNEYRGLPGSAESKQFEERGKLPTADGICRP